MFLPTDPAVYITPVAFATLFAAFIQIWQNKIDLSKKKKEIDQRIYETLILREIGERIGYELNISRILDTISGSLNKLLPFSVVSYLLISDDFSKVTMKVHLEESVSRQFLAVLKEYALEHLNQVAQKRFTEADVAEMTTGTLILDEVKDNIGSLWLTPILINNRGVGVLAVASKKSGLYKGPEMEVLTKILNQANRAVNNLEGIIATERSKLESMVTSMADGVLMFDKDLNLLIINPAAAALLGLKNGGKLSVFDVAKVLSDKLDLRTKLEEAVKNDRLVSFDNLVVGGKISKLLISPVKDNIGKLLGTVVLFHDLTAQRQLERIREDFTAMIVHELRAPLTVVRGSADTFLKNPGLAEGGTGKELLKTMYATTSSMLSLVDDLLDVAKIEAGKFQIFKQQGNLTDVISGRVAFFAPVAVTKQLTLVTQDLENDLRLSFDGERISQVLNNLVSNAIKFTPAGGKITVSAYKINSAAEVKWRFDKLADLPITFPSVVVSVSDTGEGIAEEKFAELFSKFKQIHPVEQGPGGTVGTGLGLVIARGIVQSHGGRMFVESRVNEGTTFYFTLPLS